MKETDIASRSPAQLAWLKFRQNRLAVAGSITIFLAVLIAISGGLLRPDPTPHANNQQLALAGKSPNFQVEQLRVAKNENLSATPFWRQLFFGGATSLYTEIPLHSYAVRSDSVVGFTYGGAPGVKGRPFAYHLADVAYSLDPGSLSAVEAAVHFTDVQGQSRSVSRDELHAMLKSEHLIKRRYLLGTDKFGRDMLSRLMAGTIVSLSVGLISVLISLLLGVSLGALAGYFGGWLDDVITWLINVVWSIPTLLLVIAITFALGKGFVQVFVAVGLTMWVEVARVVRGQVLGVRNLEYIEAARALGFSSGRIISRHVVPNVLGPVVVISAANFASAILLEAGLSFLGIGAQIPMASWGQMIKEHYPYITTSMAYLALLPGLCIVVLVLAFMLVGNGLRDSLDTRGQ